MTTYDANDLATKSAQVRADRLAKAYAQGFKSLPGSGSPFIGWSGLENLDREFTQGQRARDAGAQA